MCGLFGLLRSPSAIHPEWASDAFVALGMLAEERGDDSSGLALLTGRAVTDRCPAPVDVPDISLDGCRVIKGRGAFSAVWRPDLLALLDHAPVALGHTRWATQGSVHALSNASPLVVNGLVATHNGDVDAALIRDRFALPPAQGTTDSEPIFQALATHPAPEVLTALLGRAALAWIDRANPDVLHLARAALSPLTVAIDTERNLYWASNPRWFREIEQHTQVRLATAVMLREGTYLQITRRPEPEISTTTDFIPTARPADLDPRVWTGFTEADRNRDQSTLRHLLTTPTKTSGDTGEFLTVA